MASPAAMAAAAASSQPIPSGSVQLLLRNIDSRTTVVRAQLSDTLDSVLERLGKAVALRDNLWVEYAGRRLLGTATISELCLPPDATLHLTSRLVSTQHPAAWRLASELTAAARLAPAQPHFAASLEGLVWDFLTAAAHAAKYSSSSSCSPSGPFAAHAAIFLRSGAPGVLGKLYLSDDESCRFAAERAIRRFVTPDPQTDHAVVKLWTAPVLLEFSGSIASGNGARRRHADDPLYAALRRAVAGVLTDPRWGPECWLDAPPERVAEHLIRFAVEKASAVVGHIAAAYQMATHAIKEELAELMVFSWALRQKVSGLAGADEAPRWRTALYGTLVALLRCIDEYMARVETSLRRRMQSASSSEPVTWTAALPCVRLVLAELDAWSHVGTWPQIRVALRAMLAARAVGTRVLVVSAGAEWWRSMGWVTRHRDVLDFGTRRHLARALLPKLAAGDGSETPHKMLVDRSLLLPDSFWYIARATPEKLRAGLLVEFWDEMATGPGVRREWFCMVFQALFSPRHVLFSACPADRRRFFVNPTSVVDPLHLPYYDFAGRMIALALTHEISVGVSFDRTLFLQLANRSITLDDIADADPSLHVSCKKILEMDQGFVDSNVLGLTFVREVELLGSRTVAELVPGGKDIAVNSKNLREYIHLLIQDSFVNCTKDQVAYLTRGFSSMLAKCELSKNFFDALDAEDFNQMLGGSKDIIDVKEWKAHTYYRGYIRKSPQVKWFWKAVKAMTVDQQRHLLFFWTSVEYLPFDGFSGLGSRLFIFRSLNSCNHLPTSGTCFYQLNLPAYTSFDMMQRRLHTIVQEHVSSSFGKS